MTFRKLGTFHALWLQIELKSGSYYTLFLSWDRKCVALSYCDDYRAIFHIGG